jgi:hypothetical protein
VIVSPNVPTTHSSRILALWLITFVGVAIHLGMCAPDMTPRMGTDAQAADLHWAPGAERPGEQPASDVRHHHVLAYGQSGRLSPAHQRPSRSLLVGLAVGCLLVAVGVGQWHAGAGRAHARRRRGADRLGAGAHLLIRLCRART